MAEPNPRIATSGLKLLKQDDRRPPNSPFALGESTFKHRYRRKVQKEQAKSAQGDGLLHEKADNNQELHNKERNWIKGNALQISKQLAGPFIFDQAEDSDDEEGLFVDDSGAEETPAAIDLSPCHRSNKPDKGKGTNSLLEDPLAHKEDDIDSYFDASPRKPHSNAEDRFQDTYHQPKPDSPESNSPKPDGKIVVNGLSEDPLTQEDYHDIDSLFEEFPRSKVDLPVRGSHSKPLEPQASQSSQETPRVAFCISPKKSGEKATPRFYELKLPSQYKPPRPSRLINPSQPSSHSQPSSLVLPTRIPEPSPRHMTPQSSRPPHQPSPHSKTPPPSHPAYPPPPPPGTMPPCPSRTTRPPQSRETSFVPALSSEQILSRFNAEKERLIAAELAQQYEAVQRDDYKPQVAEKEEQLILNRVCSKRRPGMQSYELEHRHHKLPFGKAFAPVVGVAEASTGMLVWELARRAGRNMAWCDLRAGRNLAWCDLRARMKGGGEGKAQKRKASREAEERARKKEIKKGWR